jgi:hypothetical protein
MAACVGSLLFQPEMAMKTSFFARSRATRTLFTALALLLTAGVAIGKNVRVNLTGAEETPPVASSGSGHGTIKIARDKSVSGSIKTSGIEGTVAHIHVGAPGQSGPPIITLTKAPDGTWKVPPGSKLTDDQYASYRSGNLYVNIHSDEHKSGEIRAQLKP